MEPNEHWLKTAYKMAWSTKALIAYYSIFLLCLAPNWMYIGRNFKVIGNLSLMEQVYLEIMILSLMGIVGLLRSYKMNWTD